MIWYLISAVFLVGLWGLLTRRNLIKKVLSLGIANTAIVLFFVHLGAESGDTAPILGSAEGRMVDPVPQALMLTAIVVGICVIALALSLVVRVYRRTGSLDIHAIEKKVWNE